MSVATAPGADIDVAEAVEALHRDGITGLAGAFEVSLINELRDDMESAFDEAIERPDGAVGRGPQRWYVEVHPEALRGFEAIASHPWIHAMSTAVLGPDYKFVEVGFDVPFQGAKNQPWHRDFASPEVTWRDRQLTSLAFNLTGVDVTPDMGPFEIATGTQWDDGREWKHQMFPQKELWGRYSDLGQRKFPRRGDVSCRTALTMHRGTEHSSPEPRPVMILGVVAAEVADHEEHDLVLTRGYYEALSASLREHVFCRVAETLEPISQRHDIEGLVMGADDDDQPTMAG